jgi:transketolase
LYPIYPKLEAFGWHCQEIDGHNIDEIIIAVKEAQAETERPSIILAHTIKGKGVPYMIGDNSWHKKVPTDEELKVALTALGGNEK